MTASAAMADTSVETLKKRTHDLQRAMRALGRALDAGDGSRLLVWVIPGALACVHRPLRHHPRYGGSGRNLPAKALPEVKSWADRLRADYHIRSIICLMADTELKHYAKINFDGGNLLDFYRGHGFEVRHIPWQDPAHAPPAASLNFEAQIARIRAQALEAFDSLTKPVALHCSAGIDRSSPVAAFIYRMRYPSA